MLYVKRKDFLWANNTICWRGRERPEGHWKGLKGSNHILRDWRESIWYYYMSSDFSPCSSPFLWTLSCNFFQILRLQKDVSAAAAVQAALPGTSSSVPTQVPWALPTSKVPWAMPTSAVPAEMPSRATSPTMPGEVPTQVQVTASAFIRIRKGWGQLAHLAPQLHLHLLFKAYPGYRIGFSTLQPAVCLWWFLTARGFLPEAATPLASGKTAEKTVLQREEQQLSSWTPSEDSFPVFCVCLSPGQGFLPTKQRLLVLHFLNKLQFSFVMVKKNFFPIKSTYSHSILCLGLLLSFFDPKVTAPTIDVVWILSNIRDPFWSSLRGQW